MSKVILLPILLILGCTTEVKNKEIAEDNDAIMSIIEEYISSNPQYSTFLLVDSWDDTFSEVEFPSGYILGPYCHGLLKKSDNYSQINIGESSIYILSSTLKLKNIDGECRLYKTSPTDSTKKEYYIINDSWSNYVEKAVFIYKKNGAWYTNDKLDTIFSPKHIESDIHFYQ